MNSRYILLTLLLLAIEIAIAVFVHDQFIRPFFGDFLAVIFVYCGLRIFRQNILKTALISLFSADDEEMIAAKSGAWWESNPQRGRANNSAVLLRNKVTREFFMSLWEKIKNSGSGEPGIYLNNDKDWGTNPCCEIALRPYQFCNL